MRTPRAFSLMEIVIVIAIMAVLAAIAVGRFSRASEGSTAASVQASLNVIQRQIDNYAAEYGAYPPDVDPNWFAGGKIAYNPYSGAGKERLVRVATSLTKLHPSNKTTESGRAWWYNPNTGAFRSKVRDQGSDPETLWLYNFVNESGETSVGGGGDDDDGDGDD